MLPLESHTIYQVSGFWENERLKAKKLQCSVIENNERDLVRLEWLKTPATPKLFNYIVVSLFDSKSSVVTLLLCLL